MILDEIRFYKHGTSTKQNTIFSQKNFPRVCPVRIAMKHFQYRNPDQIVNRVRSRQEIFDGDPLMQFVHEMHFELGTNGKPKIDLTASLNKRPSELSDNEILNLRMVPEDLLHEDHKRGNYKFEPDLLPPLPIQWSELIIMLKPLFVAHLNSLAIRIRNFLAFSAIHFRKTEK